jgi:hypothetical protein
MNYFGTAYNYITNLRCPRTKKLEEHIPFAKLFF